MKILSFKNSFYIITSFVALNFHGVKGSIDYFFYNLEEKLVHIAKSIIDRAIAIQKSWV